MEDAGKAPEAVTATPVEKVQQANWLCGLVTFLSELPGAFINDLKQRTRLTKVLLFSIFLMALFVLFSYFKAHQWVFSVQAQTRVVELVTPADRETKWRINDAIICSRDALELPPDQTALILLRDGRCGARWNGYRTYDAEQTLILKGAFHVVLESRQDHTLFLALRTHRPADEEPAAKSADTAALKMKHGAWLSFSDGTPDLELGEAGKLRINIIFPKEQKTTEGARTDRVFPFSGDTTIGRDVNWAGSSMLTQGSVQIYTSDESPDKRMLVDETELLLGDQLRLDPVIRDEKLIYPKGFIRFSAEQTYLDVIAFGAADRVVIERYGDNGYNFKPSRLLLLIHDPLFVLVASVFLAVIALITSVASVMREKRGLQMISARGPDCSLHAGPVAGACCRGVRRPAGTGAFLRKPCAGYRAGLPDTLW